MQPHHVCFNARIGFVLASDCWVRVGLPTYLAFTSAHLEIRHYMLIGARAYARRELQGNRFTGSVEALGKLIQLKSLYGLHGHHPKNLINPQNLFIRALLISICWILFFVNAFYDNDLQTLFCVMCNPHILRSLASNPKP